MESHAHRLAKELLAGWLRDIAATAGWDEYAALDNLSWRVNRAGPHWGIWIEYPVLSDYTGIDRVWDEIDDRWKAAPPTYDEVIHLGARPMCVLDIAIQHKGRIAFAVEIHHKHPCDPRKLWFLRSEISVLEIPAYWVLGQIDSPTTIPAEFWLA